jgi:hypothetical protein
MKKVLNSLVVLLIIVAPDLIKFEIELLGFNSISLNDFLMIRVISLVLALGVYFALKDN